MKNPKIIIFISVFLIIACDLSLVAEAQDSFVSARRINGNYFTIYMEQGVDSQSVTMAISVPPGIKALIRRPIDELSEFNLANQLDILFLAVLEIMDIHLKKFKCDIKVCKDFDSMSRVIRGLYGTEMPKTGGVYVAETNTIYVDSETVDLNVFGHELSHAIQAQYFVVPPSMRIQEVLAGFVEYQMRKYSNTLPVKK